MKVIFSAINNLAVKFAVQIRPFKISNTEVKLPVFEI